MADLYTTTFDPFDNSSLNFSILLNESTDVFNNSGVCSVKLTSVNQAVVIGFALIFCLSVTGNGLVIATIVQQRWMRSVTNLYLLNLAVSDLLLVSICMPTTLLAFLLECFLFGSVFCKIFTFLQPVSVTASAYTLTVIALERYFAICRPLQSRHWKTRSHAAKMILLTWLFSFLINSVSFFLFGLETVRGGGKNCTLKVEFRVFGLPYMLFLTVVLFLIPFFAMLLLYGLVIRCLWAGIQIEKQHSSVLHNGSTDAEEECLTPGRKRKAFRWKSRKKTLNNNNGACGTVRRPQDVVLRNNQTEKTLLAKKRVVRMLIAIVSIFFLCWMPLYVLNVNVFAGVRTSMFYSKLILTFAYLSTCTNPICYCFFNRKFRQAFLLAFGCSRFVDSNFIGATTAFHTETKRKSSSMQMQHRRSVSHEVDKALDTMITTPRTGFDMKRNTLRPGSRRETLI